MPLLTAQNRKWWVLAAMTIMMATLNLDVTAVNLAVAPITKDLKISLSAAQWIINGFVITCAIFTTISGRFGDMYGHRKIFLLGAVILFFASLAATFAQNSWTIVLARILQGMGVAISFPMIYTINFNVFPYHQRGYAIGILTAGIGLAQAIGPTVGGFLIQLLSWRWIFFMNVPIAIISSALLLLTYKDNKEATVKRKIDFIGIILICCSLFGLMYTINEAHRSENQIQDFYYLGFFILLLILFILHELKTPEPIYDVRFLKNNAFRLINIIRMSYSYTFFTVLFLLGILLLNIMSFSPIHAGLLMLTMTGVFSLTSFVSGHWIDRNGTRVPLTIGMAMLTLGFIQLALLASLQSEILLISALIAIGIASGMVLPGTAIGAISLFESQQRGTITGIFYTNMFLAAAIGVAVSGCMLSVISTHLFRQLAIENHISLTTISNSAIRNVAAGLQPAAKMIPHLDSVQIYTLQKLANLTFMHAFTIIMWFCSGLCLLGTALSIFTPKKSLDN